MAKPYLQNLQEIIDRLNPQSGLPDHVQCRHFFSVSAAYVDGQIFMSLSPVGLALKLPKSDVENLFEQGAKSLRYFPKAPIKKDYAVLPADIVDDDKTLGDWISKSIAFARK